MVWGGIKRDKIDDSFSRLVRERDNWTCQMCGKVDDDGQAKGRSNKMDCSHFHGRRSASTRYYGANCDCLCKRCHQLVSEDNTGIYAEWKRNQMGSEDYEALSQRHHRPWKRTKAEKEEMHKHFICWYKELRRRRKEKGLTGRLDFPEYD